MLSLIQKDELNTYLESSEVVDYNNPEIQLKARELTQGLEQIDMAKSIYHFVRDEIHHSLDIGSDMVTFRASEVLKEGHLDVGWFRLDARGNRADVDPQFSMGKASLAFYPLEEGEKDYPYIFSQPNKGVLNVLGVSKSPEEVMKTLPAVFNW